MENRSIIPYSQCCGFYLQKQVSFRSSSATSAATNDSRQVHSKSTRHSEVHARVFCNRTRGRSNVAPSSGGLTLWTLRYSHFPDSIISLLFVKLFGLSNLTFLYALVYLFYRQSLKDKSRYFPEPRPYTSAETPSLKVSLSSFTFQSEVYQRFFS